MNLLAVQPGASYATADVYNGYRDALRRQGHTVREYFLDQRIDDAGLFYKSVYRRKKLGPVPAELVATKAAVDVIPQALYHNVDGVLVFSGMYFAPDMFVLLRRAGIPTALVLSESPYDTEHEARVAPWVDVVFTNERTSVPVLRRVNANTHYLPHAYDPARHQPGPQPGDEEHPAHDCVFVGTMFEERIALLGAVDWSGIDLGLYGAFEMLPSRHRLRRHIKGRVVGNREAAALYRRARIGLNLYRTSRGFGMGVAHIDRAESLSPRAVELAACGCFHLSDERAETGEVFGPAVPTFRTAEHLTGLLRYYLAAPDERAALAARLPACVAERTFDRQAEYVVSTLRAAWQGASAAIGA